MTFKEVSLGSSPFQEGHTVCAKYVICKNRQGKKRLLSNLYYAMHPANQMHPPSSDV